MTKTGAQDEQIAKTRQQILKSLRRFEASVKKTAELQVNPAQLSDDDLEAWEGLMSRFARTVDLFVSKLLRLKIVKHEPGFRGSTRDFLNIAEKLGFVDSAEKWLELKELRNRQAHDYEDEDLSGLFEAIRSAAPAVLGIVKFL